MGGGNDLTVMGNEGSYGDFVLLPAPNGFIISELHVEGVVAIQLRGMKFRERTDIFFIVHGNGSLIIKDLTSC